MSRASPFGQTARVRWGDPLFTLETLIHVYCHLLPIAFFPH